MENFESRLKLHFSRPRASIAVLLLSSLLLNAFLLIELLFPELEVLASNPSARPIALREEDLAPLTTERSEPVNEAEAKQVESANSDPTQGIKVRVDVERIQQRPRLLTRELHLSDKAVSLLDIDEPQKIALEEAIGEMHEKICRVEKVHAIRFWDREVTEGWMVIRPYPEERAAIVSDLKSRFRTILGSRRGDDFVDILVNERPLTGGQFTTVFKVIVHPEEGIWDLVIEYGSDNRDYPFGYSTMSDWPDKIEALRMRYGHLAPLRTLLDSVILEKNQ